MNSSAGIPPAGATSLPPPSNPIEQALSQARAALGKVFAVPGLTPEQRKHHARGINRALRRLEYENGVTNVGSRPGILELPVAGKCNLRCEMCGLTHGNPSYANWTLEDVERFSSLLPFADAVNPTGAGEPLLVKDFFKMLELFKSHQSVVGFYTNATQLTADKIDRLIELKVESVNVSIDGATKETFERIRKPAKFEVVVENARQLVQRRRQLGAKLPHLHVAMVLMKDNLHELSGVIQLAADLGAYSVYTMFVSDLMPEQMPERIPVQTNQVLREAKVLAKKLGIHFFAPSLLPENQIPASTEAVLPPVPANGLRCALPWNQMVVWNDGGVSPCCRISGQVDGERFGNIKDTEPAALWNSPGFIRLRQRLSTGCPPVECQRCPLRTGSMS